MFFYLHKGTLVGTGDLLAALILWSFFITIKEEKETFPQAPEERS